MMGLGGIYVKIVEWQFDIMDVLCPYIYRERDWSRKMRIYIVYHKFILFSDNWLFLENWWSWILKWAERRVYIISCYQKGPMLKNLILNGPFWDWWV